LLSALIKKGVEIALAGVLLGVGIYGFLQFRAAQPVPVSDGARQTRDAAARTERGARTPRSAALGARTSLKSETRAQRADSEQVAVPQVAAVRAATLIPGDHPAQAASATASRGEPRPSLFDQGRTTDEALAQLSRLAASTDGNPGEGAAHLDQLMNDILGSVTRGGPDGASPPRLSTGEQEQAVREFMEIQSLPAEAQPARMKDLARRLGISAPSLPDVDAAQE
jgi:hypothetical protein